MLQSNEDIENAVAAFRRMGNFARRSAAEIMVGGIQPAHGFVCFAKYFYGTKEQRIGGLRTGLLNLREIDADDNGDSPTIGKLNRSLKMSIRGHSCLNGNAKRATRP